MSANLHVLCNDCSCDNAHGNHLECKFAEDHPFGVHECKFALSCLIVLRMGSVRDERTGAELRKLRGKVTSKEVQEHTGITPSKLSRIEAGMVRAKAPDVEALMKLYGADAPTTDRLLAQVKAAKVPQWWTAFVGPDWTSALGYHLQLETEAQRIESWTIDLVPGLLQTDGYVRALIGGRPDVDPSQVDRRVELRAARRARVERGDVEVWSVIGEGALHQTVGGPKVLAEQLRYLAEGRATVQVMPFNAGAHPGLGSGFHLLHFVDWPSTLYQETITKGIYEDERSLTSAHQQTMTLIQATAMSPRDSREYLANRADELMR